VHQLSGDRRGTRSLTVARNWSLTSKIDRAEHAIVALDYEDYSVAATRGAFARPDAT